MNFSRPLLVVGDSMLDRYWEGEVERISPEAPVPVLQVRREFSRAGGAANVALNLAALGAPVSLLTLLGADEAGDALTGILRRAGVTVHAVGGHRHRTTQKIRCVAQRHQLLRTDFEEAASADCVADLCATFADVLPDDGVVVLSDYAKGVLSHCGSLIDQAHQRNCRVLCDPKGRSSGATAAPTCSSPMPPSCVRWSVHGRMNRSFKKNAGRCGAGWALARCLSPGAMPA